MRYPKGQNLFCGEYWGWGYTPIEAWERFSGEKK
jgi:hypothetical protein